MSGDGDGGEAVRMASDKREGDDVVVTGAASRLSVGGDGGELSAEKIACGSVMISGAGRGRRRVDPLAPPPTVDVVGGDVLSLPGGGRSEYEREARVGEGEGESDKDIIEDSSGGEPRNDR